MKHTFNALQWTGDNVRDMFDFLTEYQCTDSYVKWCGKNFTIDHSKVDGGLLLTTQNGEIPVYISDYVVMLPSKEFIRVPKEDFEKAFCPPQQNESVVREETFDIKSMLQFQDLCKQKLVEWYNHKLSPTKISQDNVFIVWSCKALQNYKCLAFTNITGDGIYVEYTYNGDKQELYEDVYKKVQNTCHR